MSRLSVVATLLSVIAALQPARAEEPKRSLDWPQWGGTSLRNNTPEGRNIASDWDVGGFDRKTGRWKAEKARNIKWVAQLGTQTFGTPVVAGGRIFVGTNNGAGYLKRAPNRTDLGCLLCFRESDGQFLWQFSAEKLPTGLANDWPMQGIFGSPLVEGDRLWLVSNRCEVVCLDTRGFYDGEDDGPVKDEWATAFRSPTNLHAELDQGDGNDALKLVLAEAGCRVPNTFYARVVEPGKHWFLTNQWKDGADLFEVRLENGELQIFALAPDSQKGERTPRVAARDSLTAGISATNVGPTLRALFAKAGMELPAVLTVAADRERKEWSFGARVGGVERKFRIRESDSRLLAETMLTPDDKSEADVVWRFDMIKELNVFPHNWSPCSPTVWGDTLFICTSNAVDESHRDIPHPEAPSFLALDKRTGKVLWTDNSPGDQILHTHWSSPAVGRLGMEPQVIFAGGDGWLYSFRADRWNEKEKKPELLWKFDGNPKESKLILGGRGRRNEIVATPIIHDGLVYLPMGQDPEHGEGPSDLWCIDPTKRGDVSPELAVRADDLRTPVPRRRIQAVDTTKGEAAIPNPNSAVVWHYDRFDQNGDGKFEHTEKFNRSRGTVAIKNGLLVIGDFSGVVHCLDAKTGKVHWTYDQLAASWGSPLIVDNKVYVGDEDGDVAIFGLSAKRHEAFRKKDPLGRGDFEPLAEINVDSAVYTTPIVANNVLFIANKTHLFAIEAPK